MSPDVTDCRGRGRRHRLATSVIAGACGALLAVPAFAQAAADARAYEMVSPPAKSNGGVVFGHRASDDGSAVAFQMNAATGPEDGAFALTPYVARRTPDGWVARSAAPPIRAEHRGSSEVSVWAADFSDDFSEAYILTNDLIDPADREPIETGNLGGGFDVYAFDAIARVARWISRPVPAQAAEYGPGSTSAAYTARSRDGDHVVFTASRRLVPEAPVVSDSEPILYESVRGEQRLVAILEDGTPLPAASTLASPPRFMAQARGSQAVSEDGARIYWTSVGHFPFGNPLLLREDGVRTLAVSASRRAGEEGQLAAGSFLGATRDGARAYFYSPAPLTADADANGGLYRYERDGERLTFLAFADGLDDMSYYGPVLSETGERLYFTSSGAALAPGAQPGERNLYLWDGSLRFVARISAETPGYADPRLRVTRDGRYAAFTTRFELDDPADETVAIHLYDAATGAVACASCPQDGSESAGRSEFTASVSTYSILADARNVAPRNFADDGRLFFQTPDPLVAQDTNGALDVYEFDHGRVALISTGKGTGSELVDNSDDGSSVFFMTADSLLARDTDGGYPDVYAARVGGGFPDPPGERERCTGDACQGIPSGPPSFPPPASTLLDPEPAAPAPPAAAGSAYRLLRPSARQLRRFAASGRIELRVRVEAPGRVAVTARGTIAKRRRVLGRARRVASAPGTVRLAIPLSSAARRQLATRGALQVRLVVRFSDAAAAKRMTLRLRRPASSGRRRAASPAARRARPAHDPAQR